MANEKRLIDANEADPRNLAFHIHADGSEYSPYERGYNDAVISCYGLLMNAPTVDAVEVVYCKDCARCKKGYCTIRKDSWGATLKVGRHDFCSYGERKTDNERKAD